MSRPFTNREKEGETYDEIIRFPSFFLPKYPCLDSKVIELGNTKGCIRQHDRMY